MGTARHADAVAQVMARYAQAGSSLCVGALSGAAQFVEWRHYPKMDAIDPKNRTEFYYHAHSVSERLPDEHGHFHVFSRSRRGQHFHHLLGLSLNSVGMPTRLFLTNQWVTGERWISAIQAARLLVGFECRIQGRLAPIARWLTGMVHLYQKEIQDLHHARDRWLASQSKAEGIGRTLADRSHHVVVQQRIDVLQRLSKVLV
ncbi:MAG: hypothetical protein FGM18_03080 [Burkholderiaceae bacterium]|nr:hypothetical protein [Burkholderiaceae bacterium]